MRPLREKVRDAIVAAMRFSNCNQAELGRRLSRNRSNVHRMINGANLTLDQVDRILGAMGYRLDIWLQRRR